MSAADVSAPDVSAPDYDLIVINGGAAGENVADYATRNGDGQVARVESAGIDLIRGLGSLDGPSRVRVGDRVYLARAVVLATGSVSRIPSIHGLAEAELWGTREITAADHVPDRLIILGGVAGTEMAFAFSAPGSRVVPRSGSRLRYRPHHPLGHQRARADRRSLQRKGLNGLSGDLGDERKVLIDREHREPRFLRCGRDQEIRS